MNFKIKFDRSFYINDQDLYMLYLPLIGDKSISIYKYMHTLQNNENNIFKNNYNTYENIMNAFKIDIDSLKKSISLLEAVGILKTYINKIDQSITHVLYAPKNAQEFLKNDILANLLKQVVGAEKYNAIVYSIYEFQHDNKYIETSESVDYLVKELNLEFIYKFNFEQLKTDLYGICKKNIDIDYQIKGLIEEKVKQYNLKYSQILSITNESIIDTKIDYDLFSKKIDELIIPLTDFNKYIGLKINRDKEIFYSCKNINDFNSVIHDYNNYKSENYFVSLFKLNIDNNIQALFKKLRSTYNFNDSQINVLIDFIAYKNGDNFNPNYLLKIVSTLNSKQINNINGIIEHLRNSLNINPMKKNIKNNVDNFNISQEEWSKIINEKW